MKVDALWITKPGRVEVRATEVEDPESDEVQVEIMTCGVCAWDSYLFQGKSLQEEFPFRFGHEGAGVVRQVGSGVREFAKGDKVFCAGGAPSMAQLANVRSDRLVKIPSTVESFAAWTGEPVACVVNGLDQIALRPGDQVAVVGSGYMGLLNIQGLTHMLTGRVIAFDMDLDRLALAREYGADEVYNVDSFDARKAVSDIEASGGIDIAVECSSSQAGLDLSARLLRPGGMLSLFAWHRATRTIDGTLWHMNGLHVINTSPMSDRHFSDRLRQTARLMEHGVFDQRKLITHVKPYHQCQEMLEIAMSKSDGYIKGVIAF